MNFRSVFLLVASLVVLPVGASDYIKPFVLASSQKAEPTELLQTIRGKLEAAGFSIAGVYQPYPVATVIAITSPALKQHAQGSERGGYGAVMRVALTQVEDEIQVSYTNPVYWANAYRMADNLDGVAANLAGALGSGEPFGSGAKQLTAKDMRKYHYTFMMEYFDDPSDLKKFDSHQQAVEAIEQSLASGAGGASKVYRVDLGKDSEGEQMTLFGVALAGGDKEIECSGDQFIMDSIDRSTPRHTAHLPYEMLVYGNEVEALYARFRIAISWPHLPMMASETGATFFSIMCSPGDIEQALTLAAGGELRRKVVSEK